jgi:hypothetical protein
MLTFLEYKKDWYPISEGCQLFPLLKDSGLSSDLEIILPADI